VSPNVKRMAAGIMGFAQCAGIFPVPRPDEEVA
jgi:hypothetical protein